MRGEQRIRVRLLGAFEVSRGPAPVRVPGVRLRSLLVRLALAGGRAVDQEALVEAIWGHEPPSGAVHALQTLATRLRTALGSARAVTLDAGGYRLAVEPDDVDALRFERLAAAGASLASLSEAVTLWGDPAVVAAVMPAVATRLAYLAVEAVVDLADAELGLGRADSAAVRLAGVLAEEPVHERAAGLLMDALAGQGRQAEALVVFERVRERLADTLGADPGAALRERHLRLLRPEEPAVLGAPERRRNLPAPLTSFVGREDDLARVGELLAAGRLVTVLGPGGAGKTRLAVEAARRTDFRDGVWMIDLASVEAPGKVGAAVLAGVGVRGQAAGGPAEVFGGRECLLVVDNCEHLVDAVAHLVADLLPRCPGVRVLATSREPLAVDGEALVPLGPLPLPSPDAGVSEAGRTASVRLFAERAAAVRPGFRVDASTLPDVVRVVRGLDGLPLALELAAARLRTLSLPELAGGLSDRFRLLGHGSRTALPRHRTLAAVIAWSWELLSEDERTVAERVSILPGGVTAESAAAVCEGAVPAGRIPELLAALVDRSVLQLSVPGRYRMLETLREYGTARLTEGQAAGHGRDSTAWQVRDLAAGYFARLMAGCDARLRGPGQLAAMRIIRDEYDNVLAALRRRCDSGDGSGAVGLALSLAWYWHMLDRHDDAVTWLGEALTVPGGEPGPERECARAVHLLHRVGAQLDVDVHDIPDTLPSPYGVIAAVLHGPAALRELATGGDAWQSGLAHLFLAQSAENDGDLATVRTETEAALERFGQAGDRWGQAAALPVRAQLRQYDGDLDGALADLLEAQALTAEFGALSVRDEVYRDLRRVDLHLRRGETAVALDLLAAARERASAETLPLLDTREADFWVRHGDPARARRLLDGLPHDHVRTPIGLARDQDDHVRTLDGLPLDQDDHVRTLVGTVRAALCLSSDDVDGAHRALSEARDAALRTGDLPILAQVAAGFAALAAVRGRHHEAAFLLGTASRLRGTHDRSDPQLRDLACRTRSALGEDAYGRAYADGWEQDSATAAARVTLDEPGPGTGGSEPCTSS